MLIIIWSVFLRGRHLGSSSSSWCYLRGRYYQGRLAILYPLGVAGLAPELEFSPVCLHQVARILSVFMSPFKKSLLISSRCWTRRHLPDLLMEKAVRSPLVEFREISPPWVLSGVGVNPHGSGGMEPTASQVSSRPESLQPQTADWWGPEPAPAGHLWERTVTCTCARGWPSLTVGCTPALSVSGFVPGVCFFTNHSICL